MILVRQFAKEYLFDTPGADTWTCPTGITRILVQLRAGSGGGGSGFVGIGPDPSGCGGQGCWTHSRILSVTPGVTYDLFVGAGGAGGDIAVSRLYLGTGLSNLGNGGNGEDSWIQESSVDLVRVLGGGGGRCDAPTGIGGLRGVAALPVASLEFVGYGFGGFGTNNGTNTNRNGDYSPFAAGGVGLRSSNSNGGGGGGGDGPGGDGGTVGSPLGKDGVDGGGGGGGYANAFNNGGAGSDGYIRIIQFRP